MRRISSIATLFGVTTGLVCGRYVAQRGLAFDRSAAEISRLERDLAEIRDGEPEGVEIVWDLRQLVYERTEAELG